MSKQTEGRESSAWHAADESAAEADRASARSGERSTEGPDMWAEAVRKIALPAGRVRQLSQRHRSAAWCAICFDWAVMISAMWIASNLNRVWCDALAVLVIGSRQHGLFAMLHEGVHYRIAESKSGNDWVCELLLAWPIGFSLPGFRAAHFAHHRRTNTADDPDWVRKTNGGWILPMPALKLLKLVLSEILRVQTVRAWLRLASRPEITASDDMPAGTRGYLLLRFGWRCALLTCAALVFGVKAPIVYWLVPLFTWCEVLLLLRNAAEHFGVRKQWFASTRSVVTSPLGRFFLAPHHVGLHTEHHLYRAVPFNRLPLLHQELQQSSWFRENVCVTFGYSRVVRDWVTELGERKPLRPA
ncbi:MAG: hypothetical protein RL685_68 [Pseudomonadota bacterium]